VTRKSGFPNPDMSDVMFRPDIHSVPAQAFGKTTEISLNRPRPFVVSKSCREVEVKRV